ncbi:MAG: hypothetical protein GXP25_18585 [Planctomycetes bacterium]|nr:hypothetical protein [Planctomycetota bacterium]
MRGYFVIAGMVLAIWQIVAVQEFFPLVRSCAPLVVASMGVTMLFLASGVLLGPSAEAPERRRVGLFGVVLWLAGFLPPVQLGFIRLLGSERSFSPPSLAGSMFLFALAVGPLATDIGLLVTIFGAGGEKARDRISDAFILLGSGAVLGAGAFFLVLGGHMPPLLITLCLSLLLFTAVLLMFGNRYTPGFLLIPGVLSWLAVILVIAATNKPLQGLLRRAPRHEDTESSTVASAQGMMQVLSTKNGAALFLNRLSITSHAGADEVAHIPMLQHFMPRNVLLIGGCGPQLVAQVLRHNIESLRYFHIDPMAVAMLCKHCPDRDVLRASAVELQSPLEDARAYVQKIRDPQGRDKFDVVVVDLPLPENTGINRFFTIEFFSALRRLVRDGGFAAVTLRFPRKTTKGDRQIAESIAVAFGSVFPEYIIARGKVCLLIGSVGGLGPTIDPHVLASRCRERNLSWVALAHVKLDRLPPPRTRAGANHDFTPSCYRRLFDRWVGARRAYFALGNIVIGAAGIAFVAVALGFIFGKRHIATACVGILFAGAAGGLLVSSGLLAVQAVYGTLYHEIAFLLAVWAIGLCLGQGIANATTVGRQKRYTALAGALSGLMVVSLLFPTILGGIATQSEAWWLTNIRLTLPFLGGLIAFLMAFSLGAASTLIGSPEALFMLLVSTAAGIMGGAVVFAAGMGIASPCDAAVVLSAAGAGAVVISMQT